MTDKLKRIGKKVVMACLEVLFWNFQGRTEEDHGKPQLG
jgi:hypothetical protein